jgi:hypothetical protein
MKAVYRSLWILVAVLPALASAHPFTLQLTGRTLNVYANGQHVITWNDYVKH